MIDLNKALLSREPAERILINGKPEAIKFLASGACCLVYTRADGSIIKEFFPVLSGHTPVLAREKKPIPAWEYDHALGKYVLRDILIDTLTELPILDSNKMLRDAYERCKERFRENVVIAQAIEEEYRRRHGNMSVTQGELSVDEGLWQSCPYSGGQVLGEYLRVCHDLSDRKRFFRVVLNVIYKLINDTMIYHRLGYINLDIKHHNLYAVTGDVAIADEGDLTRYSVASVRNLDFGSATRIAELISEIGTKAGGTGYFSEFLVREISSEYFSTTERFYRETTIKDVIRLCLNPGVSNEKKEAELKRLDAIAILKLMFYALNNELDDDLGVSLMPAQSLRAGDACADDMNFLLERMEDYMMGGTLFDSGNPFEDYDVYCRLYDLIYYITSSDTSPDLSGFSHRIEELLCIMGENPYPQCEIPATIREELQLHREWARVGGELLAENGLCSFEDIMKYCMKRSILMPASPGEVYYSLLTGHVYEW